MLRRSAQGLGDLRKEVVFVGGATTGLYIVDPGAPVGPRLFYLYLRRGINLAAQRIELLIGKPRLFKTSSPRGDCLTKWFVLMLKSPHWFFIDGMNK